MLYIAGLAAIFVIVLIVTGMKVVQQGETVVIERLGKYSRTLSSGVNIVWPFLDAPRKLDWGFMELTPEGKKIIKKRKVSRIDLREMLYDFERQNVITKDNVVLEINALLYFQVTDPVSVIYEIANLPDALEKLTQTTLRNVIGEMDLDQTLASRDIINSKLRAILDEATDRWGVKVNRVEIQDIIPPQEIRDAMEKQMRAERDKRATILSAEGNKRSAVLEAEGIKESQVHKAEGEKAARVLVAEGEAQARVRVAQAEAEAIRQITQAISSSGGDPANYLIAVRYLDALKEMVSGKDNKVVYLPFEATGILSSIGGIKEMLEGIKKPGPPLPPQEKTAELPPSLAPSGPPAADRGKKALEFVAERVPDAQREEPEEPPSQA